MGYGWAARFRVRVRLRARVRVLGAWTTAVTSPAAATCTLGMVSAGCVPPPAARRPAARPVGRWWSTRGLVYLVRGRARDRGRGRVRVWARVRARDRLRVWARARVYPRGESWMRRVCIVALAW